MVKWGEDPKPKVIVRAPTTDEMDKLFTPEDIKNKWNVWGQCGSCGGWTLLIGGGGIYGHLRPDAECEHCGGHKFLISSIISQRTYNAEAAKKKTAKVKKQALN